MERIAPQLSGGMPYAVGAYVIWGLLPLYLLQVRAVPAFEFVGWRILLTVPVCLLAIALLGQASELRKALGQGKLVGMLLASALLIGFNWMVYIYAVQEGHVLAASLAYYINPIANVLAGTLFLGERLSRLQWTAVATAFAGVSLLAWDARDMLWIALLLAGSFCGYGLVRRSTVVGSLPGLTIEALLLSLPATGVVAWYASTPAGISFGKETALTLLILPAGVITAVPLLLFATAARRLDFSTLGIVQYLSPTIAFILGVSVFHEPLRPVQLGCFVLIWLAIALFSWDIWRNRGLHRAT